MSFIKPERKNVGQEDTIRLPEGFINNVNSIYLNIIGIPNFDINIIRGNRIIIRGTLKDAGYEYFTVPNVGTFVLPKSTEKDNHLIRGCSIKLYYKLESSAPARLLDENVNPSKFEYPVISPSMFQAMLEAKTLSDLLSEEEKSYTWMIYLIILVFVGIIILSYLGGI